MANESEKIEQDLYSSKFNSVFNDNVIAVFKKFEKSRIIYLIVSIILALLAIIFVATMIYLNFINYINIMDSPTIILAVLYVPIILAIAIVILVRTYKDCIKKEVLNQLISFIGDFKIADNKNDREYIEKLKLFDKFDISVCENRIKGKYNSLDMDIQEIKLYDTTKQKNSFSETLVFKGILVKIPNNKEDMGRIIIKRKKNKNDKNHTEIFFEDYEFSQYYNVYTDNEPEAKSIITDSFMNQMVKYAQQDKSRNISVSFENNNINIAIASPKEWFEVAFLKPATNIATYREPVSKIISILKIVDFLKFELNIDA